MFFVAVCYCRSTAPCSGEVDSRSECHPVGWDEIDDLPQHPGRINALFSLTWNRWKWTIPVKSRKTSLSNFWVGDVFCLLNFGQILCPVQQVCAFTFGTWGGEDTKVQWNGGGKGAHVQSEVTFSWNVPQSSFLVSIICFHREKDKQRSSWLLCWEVLEFTIPGLHVVKYPKTGTLLSICIQLLRWWTPWSSSLCWVQHFGYLQAQISSGWWLVIGDLVFVNFFGRLIRSSGTGYMLYLYPSHETKYEVHGLGRKIQHLHASFKLFSNGNPTPNHSESLAIRVRIVGIEEKAGSGVNLRFGCCPIDFMT